MPIKIAKGWELPERLATPEHVFLSRRQFVAALAAGAIAAGTGALPEADAAAAAAADPTADLYPARRNEAFTIERPVTPESFNLTFNNFYEFGSSKRISSEAQALPIRPWEVAIDGEVEEPFTLGIDDLIRRMGIEERLYRHRCVEAWSMTVPWSGFPLRKLVELAKPLSAARYLRMQTFHNPKIAAGQRPSIFGATQPWPYIEGLTLAEAGHELAFLVTGAYGKPVAKQMGAPLRLATPWKYGFKSIKSIVRFSFTRERPKSFWESLQASEYGFWANVNPEVPHPRWSQAKERLLGSNEEIPTRLYNGYGEQVAHLYGGLAGERLFM